MKIQVQLFSKTSNTRPTDYFRCTVMPPHTTMWKFKTVEGSSAPEAIARAIANFIEEENGLIRAHVDYTQDKGLENLRAQMRTLKELTEKELPDDGIVAVYSRVFMHRVKRFIANLLEENDEQSLRGRVRLFESSLDCLRASLDAQEPTLFLLRL